MFFNFRDPNKFLIGVLKKDQMPYLRYYRIVDIEKGRGEQDSVAYKYYTRIKNSHNILKLYNTSRYLKINIGIDEKNLTEYLSEDISIKIDCIKSHCNLDKILEKIEALTNDKECNPITNFIFSLYISIITSILGVTSIILAAALESRLFATMNNWVALCAVILPLLIVGLTIFLYGLFGAVDATANIREWNKYNDLNKLKKTSFEDFKTQANQDGKVAEIKEINFGSEWSDFS